MSAKLIELARRIDALGYRRLHDLLRPEFPGVNHKRAYRLYHVANLAVRRHKQAKFPTILRQPLLPACAPNEAWSMDFVPDSLANGSKLRCLAIADWRRDYNQVRPHSRCGRIPPARFTANYREDSRAKAAAHANSEAPMQQPSTHRLTTCPW